MRDWYGIDKFHIDDVNENDDMYIADIVSKINNHRDCRVEPDFYNKYFYGSINCKYDSLSINNEEIYKSINDWMFKNPDRYEYLNKKQEDKEHIYNIAFTTLKEQNLKLKKINEWDYCLRYINIPSVNLYQTEQMLKMMIRIFNKSEDPSYLDHHGVIYFNKNKKRINYAVEQIANYWYELDEDIRDSNRFRNRVMEISNMP